MAKRLTARSKPVATTARRTDVRTSPRRAWVAAACLAAIAIVAYSNSFSAGFAFDNKQLILNDARVHEATAENLRLIAGRSYWWPYGESGLYRPLTTLTYLVNYAILDSRDRPSGYHVFNLAIHIANVLLVWILTHRIARDETAAFATAAIWAVVPLSTEAVTNIVGRADLLAAFGVLAGFWCYLEARERSGTPRTRWLAALFVTTTVGVFSKESAITIAGVVIAYELVWWSAVSRRALSSAALPIGFPVLLMLVQRSSVLGGTRAAEFPFTDNPIAGAGFVTGRLTAIDVMGRYLQLLVWPRTLSADYSYAQIPLATGDAGNWIRWLIAAALVGVAIALRRRHRTAVFFLLVAAITFLPASNLFFATGTIMAERLMYLPSAGLIAAVFVVVTAFCQSPQRRLVPLIAAFTIAVPFAWRTWTRNADWKDDVTLWSAAVEAVPESAKAHLALAEALYTADPGRRHIDRVIDEMERSVALLEMLPDAASSFRTWRQAAAYHLDKAESLRRLNEGRPLPEEARHSYERALVLLERSEAIAAVGSTGARSVALRADVLRLRATAHLGLDDWQRAASAATQARELDPLHPLAHRVLADALIVGRQAAPSAVALGVGMLLTSDETFRSGLIDLYRAVVGDGQCALLTTASGLVLNPECPIVREHLCAASAEAIRLATQSGHQPQADNLRADGERVRCTTSLPSATGESRKP